MVTGGLTCSSVAALRAGHVRVYCGAGERAKVLYLAFGNGFWLLDVNQMLLDSRVG
jgi:hypothetical protein